jgi:apolipoprotein N-acyltransferase
LKAFLSGRPALLALLLGAASALALPPLYALPVLLLTIPALLALMGRAPGWRQAVWWGACFGFGHHLVGIYWVTHSLFTDIGRWWWLVPVAAPGLALPLALFSIPPALLAWWCRPGWSRVLGFAGAWVLGEFARGWAFSGFPWNLLGTGWAFHPLPMQAAALLGTHGLTLLTVLVARVGGLPGWRPCAAGLALGGRRCSASARGGWRSRSRRPPGVALVVVQGNVAQDLKWDESQRRPIFQRYLDLTAEGRRPRGAARPGLRWWCLAGNGSPYSPGPGPGGDRPPPPRPAGRAARCAPDRAGGFRPRRAGRRPVQQPRRRCGRMAASRPSTTSRIWCPSASTCRSAACCRSGW